MILADGDPVTRYSSSHGSRGSTHRGRAGAACHARRRFLGSELSRIELAAPFGADALQGLDAFSHAEVLFVIDIKPVMGEFLPRDPVRQPAWSRELMAHYWSTRPSVET